MADKLTGAALVSRPLVLLVEPAHDLRVWYHSAFEVAGYQVISVLDIPQAIKVMAAGPPDVVVTELRVPSSGGRSVVEQLKTASQMPVVVVTAETGAPVVAALEAGADDVMAKPMAADLVVQRVTTVLARSPARREITRQLRRSLETLRMKAAHQPLVDPHTRDELLRLVQQIQVAVLVADDAGMTVVANEAACFLTGNPQAELSRRRFWLLVPPAPPRVQEAVWSAFLRRGEWDDLLTVRRVDGTFLRVEAIAIARLVPHVHAAALIRSPAP